MNAALLATPALDRSSDLEGRAFHGRNLRGHDFSQQNLAGADFSGADLREATFFETDLTGATLTGARLDGANLEKVCATGACFGAASLRGAGFFGAELSGTTFSAANLEGADLRNTVLRDARLIEANLEGADLETADLCGATLRGSSCARASFAHARLARACLRELVAGQQASWLHAEINEVDFTGAYLLRREILDQNYLHEFRNRSRAHAALYWAWWLTSDCGRSLLRWGACTMIVAIAFGLAYLTVDVDFGANQTLISPFYFSLVTITTLGYGDILPRSMAAQVLVMLEVGMGYMMLGGMLSIFSDKMARRAG